MRQFTAEESDRSALLWIATNAGQEASALVSEIPEEKKEMPAMPGGGGMGGMY